MEKKTKKNDATTDWLSKFGFKKATMETEDIPKPLRDKLYKDYFLFISVGIVTIYMGFRKSNIATVIFGIIILIVAFVVLKLGVEHQAEDVLRDQRPLKISLDLLEGAHIDIGGYVIRFYQEKVYTDRSKVLAIERADLFGEEAQVGKEFCTPILQDGRHLDIYVDANIIEIYVNQDEYVLSNIVYDLGSQILAQDVEKIAYFGLDTEEPVYEGEKK